jgi:hypothetical protein
MCNRTCILSPIRDCVHSKLRTRTQMTKREGSNSKLCLFLTGWCLNGEKGNTKKLMPL